MVSTVTSGARKILRKGLAFTGEADELDNWECEVRRTRKMQYEFPKHLACFLERWIRMQNSSMRRYGHQTCPKKLANKIPSHPSNFHSETTIAPVMHQLRQMLGGVLVDLRGGEGWGVGVAFLT